MTCNCCENPTPFEVFDAIALGDVAIRCASPESASIDRYESLVRERGSSAHEAGHALAALAHGEDLLAVAIGEHPMTISHKVSWISPLRRLIDLCAGDVGEGIASGYGAPVTDVLRAYIRDARRAHDGHCDFCRSAQLLVASFPHHSDDALTAAWATAFEITRKLLKTPAWSDAFWRVGGALCDNVRLSGDEVAALVDLSALFDVEARMLAGVDGFDITTWRPQ